MSRGPAVEVQGLKTLRKTLKAAGISLQDLKDAHATVARTVAHRAGERAPVRTGRLRGDIRSAGQQAAAVVSVGRASIPYANPIHWGWRARGIKPNPFIYAAADDTRDQWERQYLAALEKIIDTVEGAPKP
jgi:hypothetical protein